MRVMAIDYGDTRTGVAISDAAGTLAGFTAVLPSRNREKLVAQLAELAREHEVDGLVVGLPRNMDGTEGERAALCREFAAGLGQALRLPPVLWDERRTTIEAHGILHAGGKKMKRHKQIVDAVAASLILEGYLAKRRREGNTAF